MEEQKQIQKTRQHLKTHEARKTRHGLTSLAALNEHTSLSKFPCGPDRRPEHAPVNTCSRTRKIVQERKLPHGPTAICINCPLGAYHNTACNNPEFQTNPDITHSSINHWANIERTTCDNIKCARNRFEATDLAIDFSANAHVNAATWRRNIGLPPAAQCRAGRRDLGMHKLRS